MSEETESVHLMRMVVTRLCLLVKMQLNQEFISQQFKILRGLYQLCKFRSSDLIALYIYLDRLTLTFITTMDGVFPSCLLLCLVCLYQKMYEDEFYGNGFYANWSGLSVIDMHKTEVVLLRFIPFYISRQEYEFYCNYVINSDL